MAGRAAFARRRSPVFPRDGVPGLHALVGIVAFRQEWIDQLYVLPDFHGRGVGTALLQVARSSHSRLQLWTFQRNNAARRFYEARGFVAIRQTDGAANHEKEPDVLYLWQR